MAALICKSKQHSERLKESGRVLDFEVPYSVAEIDAAKALVLAKNNFTDAYIRPVAWRGVGDDGRFRAKQQDPPGHSRLGLAELFRPGAAASKGIPARHRRISPPRSADGAVMQRQSRGPLHDLYDLKTPGRAPGICRRLDVRLAGRVAECTGANIFFIKDGAVHTPMADCFLDGITRQTVIELAKRRGGSGDRTAYHA